MLPILSELTSSENNDHVITPVAVSKLSQPPPDELNLPPVLVPHLQVATDKLSTSTDIPLHLDSKEPLSLELFNQATSDLNNK